MLKALEISGFKSFADKTRFEFPPGITVIVGPNGSGKSNIVDAIKWVLGEQSAKSLRGKDMSDVIFKGSGGIGGRKPAGSATAMIVLDNQDRRLPYDADEVHLGRRVYRSGETEYLLNGETARLKDIKNLLRGTGVGTDAYSLIEQGKVDRLLQASPKDRRAIFEEAAGISRFKAKKTEATRRLDRVDESLIRLADIVDEVGSRYRSVKSQASKAAKFKEFSDRLQQLRTFIGTKDWRTFTDTLANHEENHQSLSQLTGDLSTLIVDLETNAKSTETKLDEASAALESLHREAANQREKIAQTESRISLNQSRLDDLNERSERLEEQESRAEQRNALAIDNLERTRREAEQAESVFQQASTELQTMELDLDQLLQQSDTAKSNLAAGRKRQDELVALISEIGRIVSAADSQVETLDASKIRYLDDVQRLTTQARDLEQQHDSLLTEQETLKEQATSKDTALAEKRRQLAEYESDCAGERNLLAEKTNEHTGLSQRAEVIEELEKKLEGVNAGAKELLQLAQSSSSGPATEVLGLVADLVSVNIQHAAVVDAALGEVAQYVVVDGEQLVEALAAETITVHGRVGILPLDQTASLNTDPRLDLSELPGVIGRASELVNSHSRHADFVLQLLGGTWVTKTLGVALQIHNDRHPPVRFVTMDGEVVEADGTVIVGPKSSAAGLVSRRSELRALKRQIQDLDLIIAEKTTSVARLEQHVDHYDDAVKKLFEENTELAKLLAEKQSRDNAALDQLKSISDRLQKSESDLQQTIAKLEQLGQQLLGDRQKLATSETELSQLAQTLTTTQTEIEQLDQLRIEKERVATSARVRLAKCEQTRESHQARYDQLQTDCRDAQQAADEIAKQKQADAVAHQSATHEIEEALVALETLVAEKENHSAAVEHLAAQRADIDRSRKEDALALAEKRDEIRKAKDELYQTQLQIEQLKSQKTQLAERLLEDYNIDIATVEEVALSDEELAERDTIDDEINDLRKKVAEIGSVNIDALNELEELESRYTRMDQQYKDLVLAKETLEKIIERINADSRKLFVDTLDAIRENFKKLFRQTFGGGQADIIMEEGVDPLEAGVEIVATPPGKPQVSNSLLSGGEKALTAVSLLMAIFQFRPSPFCVLDEVDAPFDEANIGRFIDVLRSFLGWTKFVIVTHSKKTMTAATTLYGVTMQESGVSKRVSVRFEDVSEDGQISQDAIDRDDEAA